MLKAYGIGLFTASLVCLVAGVLWFGAQPRQERGLLWGGEVYETKQEFKGYLREKGLNYKTWLARNPRAAPWEPEEITIGAITIRASTKAREDWVVRLPLATLGLIAATACAILLLRALRSVRPRLATRPMAFASAVLTILLMATIWFGTQPRQERGLLWGGEVYETKQEFKGYLREKELNYKTWLARNPRAAPWEPGYVTGPSKKRHGWVWLLVAVGGLTSAITCSVLLLRRPHSGKPSLPSALRTVHRQRNSANWTVPRLWPRESSPARRLGARSAGIARRLRVFSPLYRERFRGGVPRPDARRLPNLVRQRNLGVGEWGYVLLAVMTTGMFVLFVAFFLSA